MLYSQITMPIYEQRILSMTPAQWAQLEAMAEHLGSIALRGPAINTYSWRRVIEEIADGKLVVISPVHKAKLAKRTPELA
jgi:hypothetical protein